MRGFRLYMAFFVIVLLGYVAYTMIKGPKTHWMITLDPKDKNPFGAFVLNERLPDLFDAGVESSYLTLSQIDEASNILAISNQLDLKGADLKKLFEVLDAGGQIMLVANEFSSELQDTLGIESIRMFRFMSAALLESPHDSLTIGDKVYTFPYELIENSLEVSDSLDWEVIAESVNGPTAISKEFGEGRLTLINSALVFTNFGLLYDENHGAAEELLNLLPNEPLHYTQFYQLGKREASTPLRYFLRQPPLRWALYLSLFTIATLLIIDSWRKQRLIPIVAPPKNTSILYAKTLGGLYFREGYHARAAQKMISHFLHQIREKYFLEVDFTDKFYEKLAGKMRKDGDEIKSTFELIKKARLTPNISENDLLKLSKKIDELS